MQNKEALKATGRAAASLGEPRGEDGQVLLLGWFWLGASSTGEDGAPPLPVLSSDSLVSHLAPALPSFPRGRVMCAGAWAGGYFGRFPSPSPFTAPIGNSSSLPQLQEGFSSWGAARSRARLSVLSIPTLPCAVINPRWDRGGTENTCEPVEQDFSQRGLWLSPSPCPS